jgi:putative two-component system protein, hydrogenase maturation factor HypX/HoxX
MFDTDVHQALLDWTQPTDTIANTLRQCEHAPGVIDHIAGRSYYLHGVHEEDHLRGVPGRIIAWRGDAICRATGDGALWISHLRSASTPPGERGFKLPASHVLRAALRQARVPQSVLAIGARTQGRTYRELWYEEANGVGYLHFHFLNGALSTEHCQDLRAAYRFALSRRTRVIVLMGGQQAWCNGIHLNVIEAAASPADESWLNIHAINDLAREIIRTESHLVVSALAANAGAGGVMLALGADRVLTHEQAVLHPHYRTMGGLHGSEYWTYVLPRRVGAACAQRLTSECKPLGAADALAIGLVDELLGSDGHALRTRIGAWAEALAAHAEFDTWLQHKRRQRALDEAAKPLESYRQDELRHMWDNFYGSDPGYHVARRRFVRKAA